MFELFLFVCFGHRLDAMQCEFIKHNQIFNNSQICEIKQVFEVEYFTINLRRFYSEAKVVGLCREAKNV